MNDFTTMKKTFRTPRRLRMNRHRYEMNLSRAWTYGANFRRYKPQSALTDTKEEDHSCSFPMLQARKRNLSPQETRQWYHISIVIHTNYSSSPFSSPDAERNQVEVGRMSRSYGDKGLHHESPSREEVPLLYTRPR